MTVEAVRSALTLGRGDDRVVPAAPSRFTGRAWGALLAAIYPLLVAAPLAAFRFLNPTSDHLRVAELGADCAVVGFTILALQFAVTARLSWVEAPFGLDVLLAFHRAMALVATALLAAHPLLLATEAGASLLVGTNVEWYVWMGRGALAIVLFQVVLGLGRRALRVPYDRWRRLHDPAALAVLALGFGHSVAAGQDLHGGGLLVWTALLATALGFWLYRRVARPRRLLRDAYRVAAVEREARRVWTLTLEPRAGRRLEFAPGQFLFLRLHGRGVSDEEHPFSIASSPTRSGRIRLTIKESGDFTSAIGGVCPGDRASVHGPFGRFSYALHPEEGDLVFVAGGVGITPLMSMLRAMRDRAEPRRVWLVYASRTERDIVFREELAAMEAGVTPLLRVTHVLSQPGRSWLGESGPLGAGGLARLCGGVEGKAFYLCCPPTMTVGLIRGLEALGASPRRIHADYFSL